MSENITYIGIVGGGRGGCELMKLIHESDTASVSFIVDVNPQAEGLVLAREMGIQTASDLMQTLQQYQVNCVIEATGSSKVLEIIREHLPDDVELITNAAALLMYNVTSESRRRLNQMVLDDVRQVHTEIDKSVADVQQTLKGVKMVASDLKLLSVNARIESARAGEHGSGFAVVADKVKETAGIAEELAEKMESVTHEILQMSGRLDQSMKRLEG